MKEKSKLRDRDREKISEKFFKENKDNPKKLKKVPGGYTAIMKNPGGDKSYAKKLRKEKEHYKEL